MSRRTHNKARILAIETSSPRLSLAAGTQDRVRAVYRGALQWRHAESLFDGLQQLLTRCRWPVQSLTGVVVSTGPGSFTGIRIGLAAARALGQALKIPVVGVSSLETMAYGSSRAHRKICPVIDALRGEVFTALYETSRTKGWQRLWAEQRLPRAVLDARLAKNGTVFRVDDKAGTFPRADVMLALGRRRLLRAGVTSYQRVKPLYLREAAAQEASLARRRAARERQR